VAILVYQINPFHLATNALTVILVVGIVLGLLVTTLLVFRSVLFGSKGMKNGLTGTLHIIGVSMPPLNAAFGMISITGVLSAEGIPAREVTFEGMCKVSRWPSPDDDLPVSIDHADHSKYIILWDQVADSKVKAADVARQLADQMNSPKIDTTGLTLGFAPSDALSASIVSAIPTGVEADGKTQMVISLKINRPDGSIEDAQVTKNVPPQIVSQLTPGRIIQVMPDGDSWTLAVSLPQGV